MGQGSKGRGRYDGEHDCVRYFSPVRVGSYCSFVRKGKVTQAGIGLVEAVKDRYGVVEGKIAGVEQKEMLELFQDLTHILHVPTLCLEGRQHCGKCILFKHENLSTSSLKYVATK